MRQDRLFFELELLEFGRIQYFTRFCKEHQQISLDELSHFVRLHTAVIKLVSS